MSIVQEKQLAFQIAESSIAVASNPSNLAEERLSSAITIGLLEIARSSMDSHHWGVASILRGDSKGPAKSLRGTSGSVENIAQSHAYLMHALLRDDSYRTAFHPGQLIIPTCLALGQAIGVSGREFREATSIAYEVACRFADIFLPDAAFRGWRITPLLAPVVASAAAISLLAPRDTDKLSEAITLSAAQMGGTLHTARSGNQWQTQSALQVSAGIFAAKLVSQNSGGTGDGLEGNMGAMEQFLGRTSYLPPSSDHRILDLTFKLYAAPMYAQSLLQAFDSLDIPKEFQPKRIDVFISKFANSYAGDSRKTDAIASLEELVIEKMNELFSQQNAINPKTGGLEVCISADTELTDDESRIEIFDLNGKSLVSRATSKATRVGPNEIIKMFSCFSAIQISSLVGSVEELSKAKSLSNLQECWESIVQSTRNEE
jgi:hypothetical protein